MCSGIFHLVSSKMKLVSRELLEELTICFLESEATEWCVHVYQKKLQGPRKRSEWLRELHRGRAVLLPGQDTVA